ncbi:hypothetical protein WN943_015191 [Citrus x changshan-huyou]
MDCFNLADENEFALSDLNDEVNEVEQVTTIEDFIEMMAKNDDRDVFADVCKHPVIWGDNTYLPCDKCLPPQITECSARSYRNKYSVIWGDKLLSPVRQCLSPQIPECLSL